MAARLKTLTTSEKLKLRQQAARLSKPELERLTVEELRQLCQHSLPGVRGMKKTELVETVYEWSNQDRQNAALATVSAISLLKGLGFNPETIEELYKVGTPIEGAADFFSNLLKIKGYKPSTIVKTVLPDLSKLLRNGEESARLEWGEAVRDELFNRYRDTLREVNNGSMNTVSANQSELRSMSESAVLDWADGVLSNLSDDDDNQWKAVVLAIAVATGRRAAEVMGNSSFAPVPRNPKVAVFEGQLKTKSRVDVGAYQIPLLLDYDKIKAGLDWLDERDLRGLTTEDVNKRAYVYTRWLKTEKETGLTKFKESRDFYAAYCVKHLKPDNQGTAYYLSTILGHGYDPEKGQDLVTAQSYQKVYLVD